MINVGFIGAGNMGFAIMKGVASSKLDDIKLYAFDPDTEKLKRLEEYNVSACKTEQEVMENCKFIFLAVKPQILESVLNTLAPFAKPEQVFVSICAGISGEYIQSKIPNAKTVLVMPNTPMLLGEGASALARVEPTDAEEFDLVCKIIGSCGEIAVIDKSKMKEIIAINGSSPAFIYLFAKGFIDYARSVDIDENSAKALFAKTLIGSAKMITDSGNSIDELIKMVSSPGGTTLAGLDKLYEGKLTDAVEEACKACTKRAYELSK